MLISSEHNLPTTHDCQATLGRARRSFERGLLALIVDEDRRRGLVTLQHVARLLMEVQPSSKGHLNVVVQWLGAIRREQLQLSEETFTILRGLGQIIRTWELVIVDAESDCLSDIELQTLSASTQIILQQVSPIGSEPEGSSTELQPNLDGIIKPNGGDSDDHNFILVLQTLDQALGAMQLLLDEWALNLKDPAKVAAVARGFKALRELGDDQRLGDVIEVTWAIENMLDRLVDGTLAVSADFHVVTNTAINFLVTLSDKLRQISAGSGVSSFIDDYIYAEIIESADILASGGDLGLKSQAFEEDFPREQDPDLGPSSKSENQLYAATTASTSADGLPLSLEQTIKVFQAASHSLDEALLAQQDRHVSEHSGLSEELLRMAHTLRQHLLSSTEISDEFHGLLLADSRKQLD